MNGSEASGPKKPKRQDLSYADQQELLAFVEKRRWFEGKLEVSPHRPSSAMESELECAMCSHLHLSL